jgi:hypothetical protein
MERHIVKAIFHKFADLDHFSQTIFSDREISSVGVFAHFSISFLFKVFVSFTFANLSTLTNSSTAGSDPRYFIFAQILLTAA